MVATQDGGTSEVNDEGRSYETTTVLRDVQLVDCSD